MKLYELNRGDNFVFNQEGIDCDDICHFFKIDGMYAQIAPLNKIGEINVEQFSLIFCGVEVNKVES